MKFKKLYPVLFCVLLHSTLLAQSEQDLIKQVENGLVPSTNFKGGETWTIQERMEHYRVPGLSIAVIKDHQVAWTKGYGVKKKGSDDPVDVFTLFQCASISKPVTAAAALRMAEQGKFDLDADINDYLQLWKLPENRFTREKKVTLRHLVSHTGGLTVHGFPGYRVGEKVPTLIEILDGSGPANTGAIRVDKTPGGDFRYSGGGYCIMQQMMIEATNKEFPEVMKELALEPLGMKQSTFEHPLPVDLAYKAATGHRPYTGDMVEGSRHTYPEMAPAGLYSTASELAEFWIELSKAYHGKSERLLSEDMAQTMLTTVSGRFGLGVAIKDNGGEVYIGHGGWNEGFSSEAGIHRDNGYGVVVLTNGNSPPLIEEIARSVARVYGWKNHSLPELEILEMTENDIASLAGRYNYQGNLVRIDEKNGKLFLSTEDKEPAELHRVGENQFAYKTGENLVCYFEDDNNVGQITFRKPWEELGNGMIARKLLASEKLAIEWLVEGEYEKALAGFLAMQKQDPRQESIDEGRLNQLGYQYLGNGQVDLAIDIFRINVALYPDSFNTYDSLGEGYLKKGETNLGISNYKKSLELNPENDNATKILKDLEAKAIESGK